MWTVLVERGCPECLGRRRVRGQGPIWGFPKDPGRKTFSSPSGGTLPGYHMWSHCAACDTPRDHIMWPLNWTFGRRIPLNAFSRPFFFYFTFFPGKIYITQNVPFQSFLRRHVRGVKYSHNVVWPSPELSYLPKMKLYPRETLISHFCLPCKPCSPHSTFWLYDLPILGITLK